ncbi:hypothetical protein PQ472_00175 [Lacticaseibacillus pabuli]|uniref:Uncharacterized protein n=1 Tax=Lacticaseibacillus pabuli TaxID=3025672 RepID=A0ABY7WXM7_9LACO|nr:hypothetical protein [Lacticaseibacillus sp. KACC 23028]WDF82690.1 hypothetical protein PQ472_00175 [Lacticaseibacillus sp. KACC 23028]
MSTVIYTMPDGTQILSAPIPPAPVKLYETMKRRFHLDHLTTSERCKAFNTIAIITNRILDHRQININQSIARLTAIAGNEKLPYWIRKDARTARARVARLVSEGGE